MPKAVERETDDNVEGILAEYREKLPTYRDFATRCKELVEQLLQSKNVRVHSVTCRPKDIDRLKDKLGRPDKHYDSLTDVTDLAGVRIITHLADEVDAVAAIIEREFRVIPEHSIDKRQALDPDRFGYLSLHYVCTLANKRARLTENAPYRHLICEIQVRSILQHAWAEIEHNLGYSSAEAIPRSVRRRFCRLAALLETADSEFMGIREELEEYAAEVRKDITQKPREVLLDKVSLGMFIEQDPAVRRTDERMVASIGGGLKDPTDLTVERNLIRLRDVGMQTIDELRSALAGRQAVILRQFRDRLAYREPEHINFPRGISLFHLWQVILAEKGDIKEIVATHERLNVELPTDPQQFAESLIDAVRRAQRETAGKSP